MLSLDLFTSKFEQHIHEGAVDSVVEQDQPDPQEKIPTNINQFNTEDNRALVKRIWAQISQHAINDTAGWLTLEWPNQPAATLSRNQVWTVINKIAKMPATQRNAFALSTLGDRNAFLTWMNGLKIITRPAPKKEPARGQQSLDLKELDQKKSSEESKYRDVRVARAMRQATAEFPSAGSDVEAFAKSMLNAQDKDQEDIAKLRQTTQRQRELIKKNDSLDADQQRTITNIEKEIDDVEANNSKLATTIQQMQRANSALQQKLDQMRRRTTPAPTAPELGVSVATDKIPPQPASSTTPQIDTRARQYAQQLRKQLNQLQTMVALKAPEDQSQLKQDIDALKAQLAKLQQREPVATATPATVGGQTADVLPAQGSADSDDGVIDLTGIDDVLAPYRKPAKKSAKKKSKTKKSEFELTEANAIPLNSVVQGYNVTYDPNTRRVTVSRKGRVIGSGINKTNNPKHHLTLINRIIDRAEDEKYPTDINVRDVAIPMKKVAEALPAKALEKLYRWKNTQNQPVAEPAVATTEPQPVPARLSDLQSKHQKVANLADIKKTIETLQARATRGGRILPRGLAADLEDYFTTTDVDSAYDDMMAKYQKQLGALQQYLGMRKVLWSPRKDVHENKSSKAYEQGGRAGYYGRAYDNPYESGTDDHADYKRGYRDFRDEGKDYGVEKKKQSPSIDRDRDYLEDIDRSGQEMYQAQEVYMLTHNGQEVAFYTLKDLKRAEQDAQEMQKKLGGEVHLRKVMREAEQQPQDEVMKRLFKDFGDIFGKQPPQPKSPEPEQKEVKEMNRAGYNPLTSEKHWHEVERQLAQLINDRTLDPESRAEARQRYLEKRKEAQQKGWAK
jgi:hypothetical protein